LLNTSFAMKFIERRECEDSLWSDES